MSAIIKTPLATLTRQSPSGVFVLSLHALPDNRFTTALIRDVNELIDVVEASSGDAALVIASASPKFFSNGHDPGAISSEGFIDAFYALLDRIASLGVLTVAAVNGHAFAGGLLLALAADFRVMRAGRGYACMNEIDMHAASNDFPVKPGTVENADAKLFAFLRSKVPQPLLSRVMLTGKRYGGSEAAASGLVDVAVSSGGVLPAAIQLAETLASKGHPRNRAVVATMKREMFFFHSPKL